MIHEVGVSQFHTATTTDTTATTVEIRWYTMTRIFEIIVISVISFIDDRRFINDSYRLAIVKGSCNKLYTCITLTYIYLILKHFSKNKRLNEVLNN